FVRKAPEPLYISYRINAGYLPPDHWLHDPQQGGGRIIGEACHFIDFLVFLVGEMPNNVLTSALPDQGRYRKDNVHLTFKFPGGSLGTVTYLANGDKNFHKERIEVFTGGQIAILEDYRVLTMVKDGRRTVERTRFRQDKGHQGLWEAYIRSIQQGGPPPIPNNQIIGVTKASFSAMNSLNKGQPVDIRLS
ncbi:MAG: Gfo/Idh/MocA family oxidoreductase, partial [Anaerolineales bacterium]